MVKWLSRLVESDLVPHGYFVRIAATGMTYGPQNSTVAEVVDDGLACPAELFDKRREEVSALAVHAVTSADGAVRALGQLADDLAVAAGGDRGSKSGEAASQGYAELDLPIRRWLADLRAESDLEAMRVRWHRECHRLVRRLGDDLLTSAGPAAWRGDLGSGVRGVDAARADARFRANLRKALPLAYIEEGNGGPPDSTVRGEKETA